MKRKIIYTLCFFSLICSSLFAQTKDSIIKQLHIEEDLNTLNRKIEKMIQADDSLSRKQGLQIIHVFLLENKTATKADFFNFTFLDKMESWYRTEKKLFKKKKYLDTHGYIYDSLNQIIASICYGYIYKCNSICNYASKESTFIKSMDFVFQPNINPKIGVRGNLYFGIKNNKLYVLDIIKNETYSIEEFVDLYWDKYYGGEIKVED